MLRPEDQGEHDAAADSSDFSSIAFANLPQTPKPRKRRRFNMSDPRIPAPVSSQASSVPKGTPFPRSTPRAKERISTYEYRASPPTTAELLVTLDECGVPAKVYQDPFYSNGEDVPEHAREYAGLVYNLKGGTGIGHLEDWVGHKPSGGGMRKLDNTGVYGWEYASAPPSVKQTRLWLETHQHDEAESKPKNSSQVRLD